MFGSSNLLLAVVVPQLLCRIPSQTDHIRQCLTQRSVVQCRSAASCCSRSCWPATAQSRFRLHTPPCAHRTGGGPCVTLHTTAPAQCTCPPQRKSSPQSLFWPRRMGSGEDFPMSRCAAFPPLRLTRIYICSTAHSILLHSDWLKYNC